MPIFEDIQKCFVKVTIFDWHDSRCLEHGIIGKLRRLDIDIRSEGKKLVTFYAFYLLSISMPLNLS